MNSSRTASIGSTLRPAIAQDRRKYARRDMFSLASYILKDDVKRSAGHIINVGNGGMRLSSQDSIKVGSVLRIHFAMSHTNEGIVVQAKVVLSFYDGSKGKFIHGLAFTSISPEHQRAISNFVDGA